MVRWYYTYYRFFDSFDLGDGFRFCQMLSLITRPVCKAVQAQLSFANVSVSCRSRASVALQYFTRLRMKYMANCMTS